MARPTFDLGGRTALVTGASRGIGKAIAVGLAAAGADVAVLARGADALAETAKEIEGLGVTATVVPCDVDDPAQIQESVASVIERHGAIDISVHAAGGFEVIGPFLELTEDDWSDILRTNLESVVRFSRAVGLHMTERGSGSIVNIASVGGYAGTPMLSAYAVAKAGIISLTQTTAVEWGARGVRVNAIAPGWTRTELTSGFAGNPELADGLIASVPAGRWADPEDLAGAAVYLASDAARMVTGTCVTVDGGVTAYDTGPAMLEVMAAGRMPV